MRGVGTASGTDKSVAGYAPCGTAHPSLFTTDSHVSHLGEARSVPVQGAQSLVPSLRHTRAWKNRGCIKWSRRRIPVSLSGEQFVQLLQGSIRNHLVVGDSRIKILLYVRRQHGLGTGGRRQRNTWTPLENGPGCDHHCGCTDHRQNHAPVQQHCAPPRHCL